ncbi:MAG: hypothetical protein ACK5IB_05595 [Qingshengfaniella sp.]
MTGHSGLYALVFGLFFATAATASEPYSPYSGILRGTDGVAPVRLRIRNDTNGPLTCTAALAHWYSQPLGTVGTGQTLDLSLWHAPENGTLSLLNAGEDQMPLEAIWCHTPARADRARLRLPLRAGQTATQWIFACTPEKDQRLICPATGG